VTDRQQQFARIVAAGRSLADAYRIAYPRAANWTSKAVRTRAARLAKTAGVLRALAILRQAADSSAILDCHTARVVLSERVEAIAAANGPTIDLCRAVDSLARISGWNQPDAVAVAAVQIVTPEERARRIREALGIPEDEPEVEAAP